MFPESLCPVQVSPGLGIRMPWCASHRSLVLGPVSQAWPGSEACVRSPVGWLCLGKCRQPALGPLRTSDFLDVLLPLGC